MNCEKCRWYKRTYPVYTFGEFSARCLLGGCDESQHDPRVEAEPVKHGRRITDVVERKHGKWDKNSNMAFYWKCSE